MGKPIEEVRAKIDRARTLLEEVKAALRSYWQTAPFEVQARRDPSTQRVLYCVTKATEPPVAISLIAGDALNNLRSSLDLLARGLVKANGQQPSKETYFPFAEDAHQYASGKKKKVKGMSAGAILAIDALKPYRGGNDPLWRLNKLNNISKHRALVTVGTGYRALSLTDVMMPRFIKHSQQSGGLIPDLGGLALIPSDKQFPLKVGAELFSDSPDAEPAPIRFMFDLAIGEPDADMANGEPLVQILERFLAETETAVTRLEQFL